MRKTTRFDAADYLDTEERQVAYIAAALSRRRSKPVTRISCVTRLVSLRAHAA
jgi:DNA-binding phage protein